MLEGNWQLIVPVRVIAGDLFQITREELAAGEDVASCPSCSLFVKVINIPDDFSASPPPPEQQQPQHPIAVA